MLIKYTRKYHKTYETFALRNPKRMFLALFYLTHDETHLPLKIHAIYETFKPITIL